MKYTIRAILVITFLVVAGHEVSGQIFIDSFGEYINPDKTIERIITFEHNGYVFVEGVTPQQNFEIYFPEGPNDQKNGAAPLLVNVWIATNIRDIMTKQNSACYHYYKITGADVVEYKCAGRNQVSAPVSDLPAKYRKVLLEFRARGTEIWPDVRFPK